MKLRGLCLEQVMSQQTQVGRAAEYWLRWMAKWPTVQVSLRPQPQALMQESCCLT